MGVGREVAGQLVDIDAQQPREEILVDPLAVIELVIAATFVTQGNIQVAIRAKVEIPAVVIVRLVVLGNQRHFGGEDGVVGRVPGQRGEARHPLIEPGAGTGGRQERVENIKIVVVRKIGMEGEAEHSRLAARVNRRAEVEKLGLDRSRAEPGDRLDAAGFFDDKKPVGLPGGRHDGQRLTEGSDSGERRGGRKAKGLGILRQRQRGVGHAGDLGRQHPGPEHKSQGARHRPEESGENPVDR